MVATGAWREGRAQCRPPARRAADLRRGRPAGQTLRLPPAAGCLLRPSHMSTAGPLPSAILRHMQMGELLRKNPAVAVPVVLARLVQKDSEWCALVARVSSMLS